MSVSSICSSTRAASFACIAPNTCASRFPISESETGRAAAAIGFAKGPAGTFDFARALGEFRGATFGALCLLGTAGVDAAVVDASDATPV